MPTTPFAQRIRQGAPLLVDGAMGTMLHEQGSASAPASTSSA